MFAMSSECRWLPAYCECIITSVDSFTVYQSVDYFVIACLVVSTHSITMVLKSRIIFLSKCWNPVYRLQSSIVNTEQHCEYRAALPSYFSVPLVLRSCAETIETHGIVDGIYRLSGVASNIQRLR